ncbi:hypothetical protein SD70_21635 [Gordoniibacillus kamchatkensis]|uniref:ROK family protein n=1 Tax=Gordoniibacillus kamchatkensis TaxID=1590651 RepID=A0ABR5AE48_9BACL|nr:ROK family protein [Paenibacillus sp. VKM B-2647]KIL39157.1 hypothetical protein SD70_21635 [Paenibacillus sp. VKM B-2647]
MGKRAGSVAAGIDIGGTKTMLMLADEDGIILDKQKVPTPQAPAPELFFAGLMARLDERLAAVGTDRTALAAVGIGLPGVIDVRAGIADNCTALGWGRVDVQAEMRKHAACPVVVENDVNLAALGEGWLGAAKQASDYYLLCIGTGIGSAIVAGGVLLRGSRFAAGEVGYWVLDDTYPDEFSQDYSSFGRLESIASGPGIAARARQALASFAGRTVLRERCGGAAERLTAGDVLQAAAEGDALAADIVRQPLRQLAMAAANAASLLNPELIVIGGGVADSSPHLCSELQRLAEPLSPNPVRIVPAEMGNEAGAAGALYAALRYRKER